MTETNKNMNAQATEDIRIVRLNSDKTRKTSGSDIIYQVYFELSGTPHHAWRNIFDGEWKALNPDQPHLWQAASIERLFLLMHCPLKEIAVHLPVLQKAISLANNRYKQYVKERTSEQERREDAWKDERDAVDEIAESLHFDRHLPD